MIQEAYCSFETSKLLKEKGFNEICYTCYMYDKLEHDDYPTSNSSLIEDCISAPTHQLAMSWLREVHKIVIVIDAYTADHWDGCIDSFEINIYSHASTIMVPREIAHHNDYIKATETALKYVLENLI